MNFSTKKLQNNKMLFVYQNGQARETDFTEVEYRGDNYVLAREKGSVFYTMLDLNGNEGEKKTLVVHRFHNGMLLTYSTFEKRYVPSDGQVYVINYNVYKVLNAETRRSYTINVVQSESLLSSDGYVAEAYKVAKLEKSYLGKEMFCFNELIFSDMIDDKFILSAGIIPAPGKHIAKFDFNRYTERKVWGVADITSLISFNGETDITIARKGIAFKDAEAQLFAVIDSESEFKFYENYAVKEDVVQSPYSALSRKTRLSALLNRLLDLGEN
ncbi:MAG: hypothetical protein ACO1N9_01615 [Flavobacterium sp.]